MLKVKTWLSMLLIVMTLSIALAPLMTYARTPGALTPVDSSGATPERASDVPQPLPHDCVQIRLLVGKNSEELQAIS